MVFRPESLGFPCLNIHNDGEALMTIEPIVKRGSSDSHFEGGIGKYLRSRPSILMVPITD